jgi:hypothetical protein
MDRVASALRGAPPPASVWRAGARRWDYMPTHVMPHILTERLNRRPADSSTPPGRPVKYFSSAICLTLGRPTASPIIWSVYLAK